MESIKEGLKKWLICVAVTGLTFVVAQFEPKFVGKWVNRSVGWYITNAQALPGMLNAE